MTLLNDLCGFPPLESALSVDDVHVFCVELNLSVKLLEDLAQTLSPDEKLRADRFYFERDRKRFIASRGLLRVILSRYLNLEPDQVQFSYGSHGKPALANTYSGGRLCFNLSHSNELALYAIACDRAIGIDLEYIRPMSDVLQLAKRFFSPREYTWINSLSQDQQQEAFFNIWTVKEAYLKATGEGLAGLEQVEVALIPGEAVPLLNIKKDPLAVNRWSVAKLTPAPNYAAALVVEGQGWNLQVKA